QSPCEEGRPDAIHGRGREILVVLRRQPGRQVRTVGAAAAGDRLAALEELATGRADRLARVVRVGDVDVQAGRAFLGTLGRIARLRLLDPRRAVCLLGLGARLALGAGVAEERRHAPEVVHAPFLRTGVLVALGTLDLDAHEQVADRAR